MKNSWQILTLLMALALVAMAIKITIMKRDKESSTVDIAEVVYNNIMTRSSVRSYTTQLVEQEKVEKLLRAGMAAPTGGNAQPWEFIVITDRAIFEKLPEISPGLRIADKAQLAIAVVGTPEKAMFPEYWMQDCSAATENILLAAHGMGLGAVWCGVYPENGTGRVEKIGQLLSIAEGSYALNIILIGYPDSEPVIKDKWDPAKVRYLKNR